MQAADRLYHDLTAAFGDALNAKWGNPSRHPHPQSQAWENNPLSSFAEYCGKRAFDSRGDTMERNSLAVMGHGMVTGDFQNAFATAAHRLATKKYEGFSDHLRICSEVPVNDFKTVKVFTADLDDDLQPVGDTGQIHNSSGWDVGASASLSSFVRLMNVSRQIVINDDLDVLKNYLSALGAAAGKKEGAMVSATLESNALLSDGAAMFGTANIVASALSATTLDAAMGLLRDQKNAAGNKANNKLYALVTASGMELNAASILHYAGLDSVIRICLPWLPAGRWFAMADPMLAPVVGRLLLKGSTTPISVGPVKREIGADYFSLKGYADLGVVAIGRLGVVKGGS